MNVGAYKSPAAKTRRNALQKQVDKRQKNVYLYFCQKSSREPLAKLTGFANG
jgi:hypothetical protein